MATMYFAPHESLRGYIEEIIIIDQPPLISPATENIFTFVPDYFQYLCFVLKDNFRVFEDNGLMERSNALIIGSHLHTTSVQIPDNHYVIYVKLKPAALYSLTKLPQNYIVNKCIDARHFFDKKIDNLIYQLMDAKNVNDQIFLVQEYLISNLSEGKLYDRFTHAIDKLRSSKGNLSVEHTAMISCLSPRQFERVCKQRVGLSPKTLGRLIRFSTVYQLKQLSPSLLWNDIALQCGYYDQMHMIKDFKKFANTNPSTTKQTLATFPLLGM